MGRKTLWKTFLIQSADDFNKLQSSLSGLPAHHNPKYTTTMAGGHVGEIETNLPLSEIHVWFRVSDVRMPDYVTDTMPLDERVKEWDKDDAEKGETK